MGVIEKAAYDKARYEANRERELDRGRRYRARNVERERVRRESNADAIHAQQKIWRQENSARRLITQKEYRVANRESLRAAGRQYYRDHPEIFRVMKQTRRARLANALVEKVNPYVLYDRDEGICQLCHKPASRDDFHVDHVRPLSRGGEHSYANTQIAHPFCNISKGAREGDRL